MQKKRIVRTLLNPPSLVFVVLMAIGLNATAKSPQIEENPILAVRQNDKISAWRIDPSLLKLVADLNVKKAEQAKQISDLFLSAVVKKDGNKECCYKKVADNVWSCCDGRFVTSSAATLKNIFQLAESAPRTKPTLDPSLISLKNALEAPASFIALNPDKDKAVEFMARELSAKDLKDDKG